MFVLLDHLVVLSASDYEVDGEIAQTLFKRDGSVQLVTRSRFTVYVRDCSWLIKTIDHDEDGTPLIAGETSCTNGAEVYEVVGPFNKEAWKRGIAHWNEGLIISNNFPVAQRDDFFIGHLWLMFASGCYFTNVSTGSLPVLYDVGYPDQTASWELINGLGSLPMSIVYVGGYGLATNATYEATGVTNAGTVQSQPDLCLRIELVAVTRLDCSRRVAQPPHIVSANWPLQR